MRDCDLFISELNAEVSKLRKELAEIRIEIVNGLYFGPRFSLKRTIKEGKGCSKPACRNIWPSVLDPGDHIDTQE